MAALTAASLIGTGLAAYQTIKAGSEKKSIGNEIDNYNVYEPTNSAKNISLNTLGTDIMRQDAARDIGSLTDAAISGGVRGVMGAIPKIQAGANKVNQDIAMDYANRDERRQYAVARGEEKIMDWKINRDNQNIAALSSQYNASNENFNRGLWGMASGVMSTVRGVQQDKENGDWGSWFGKGDSE